MPSDCINPTVLVEQLEALGTDIQARENGLHGLTKRDVSSLLLATLRDNKSLGTLAANSYTHQLGFDKFLLSSSTANNIWLRMHYWPESINGHDSDIHSHCADFTSKVLAGSLSSLEYDRIENGPPYFEYEYSFNIEKGESSSKFKGQAFLIETGRKKISPGTTYSLSAEKLHQTTDVAAGTITISIWGSRNQSATVFRNTTVNGSDVRRTGMDITLAQVKLWQIIEILGK